MYNGNKRGIKAFSINPTMRFMAFVLLVARCAILYCAAGQLCVNVKLQRLKSGIYYKLK